VKAFIRDNLMIVVSVALPLLVVVVFALATLVPRWLVEPPQYDFLMTAEWPGSRGALPVRIDMSVTNGKLRVRAIKLENGERAYAPRLFEFVAATQSVREIMLDWPDDLTDLPDGTVIGVPEFDSRRIDPSQRAPDGYAFERLDDRGGGIFTELFGAGRRNYAARLRKDGAVVRVRVPVDVPSYYYGLAFLGWVVE